jgi:putative RecB family exonuclease
VARSSTLSYSSLRTYLECPLRWKFLYIDGLQEAPRGYFSFGRTVHAVLEELVRPLVLPFARNASAGQSQRTLEEFGRSAELSAPKSPMGREELLRTYSRLWVREGYTSPEEEARYRTLGEELLLRYYDGLLAEPPRPVAVEEHLEANWEGIPIHGYVDRIDLTPTGGLEVLDYKTTRGLSWADAQGSDQLSFYQVLVQKNYPSPVESLALYDLRGSVALRVPRRSEQELLPLQEQVGEVASGIRDEVYDPTPGRHCQRCEFQGICPEFRKVPVEEAEHLQKLVDRFISLRNEEVKVDGELKRVAEELHREAERIGVHRIPGKRGTALRRREERIDVPPDSVRELLVKERLLDRVSAPDPERLRKLLKDPALDPGLRRKLLELSGRAVRWFWELESEGEGRPPRNG